MHIKKLIKENNCTIVDVRTKEEFESGNIPGSINIPLGEIVEHLEEVQEFKTPLVICCASGARSKLAAEFLSLYKIECYNGGSWIDLNIIKN